MSTESPFTRYIIPSRVKYIHVKLYVPWLNKSEVKYLMYNELKNLVIMTIMKVRR